MLKPKIYKPIVIIIENKDIFVQVGQDIFHLQKDISIGGNHFGIKILKRENDQFVETTYPTHCPVWEIDLHCFNFIKVHEMNKLNPWFFTMEGNIVKCGLFDRHFLTDCEYLASLQPSQGHIANSLASVNTNLMKEVGFAKRQTNKTERILG